MIHMTKYYDAVDRSNDGYEAFRRSIQKQFDESTKDSKVLYKTDADGLWDLYLSNIPEYARQHYNCNACRHFISRFGGLVVIDDKGNAHSVLWDDAPDFFTASANAMRKAVQSAKVSGVFITEDVNLGVPLDGERDHLHIKLRTDMQHRTQIKTPSQLMAEKDEEHKMLTRAWLKYAENVVDQAVALLKAEALYRSDRFLGIAEWFKALYVSMNGIGSDKNRNNLMWRVVGTAPSGFCHISSSIIGTLLDDIEAGFDMEAVKRRFAENVNPSTYMRSQTAPTQGNINQAEKIVEKLGIAASLRRRYATLDELPSFIWKAPSAVSAANKAGGVFANVAPKGAAPQTPTVLPSNVMTWDKFKRTVLPDAEQIEIQADNTSRFMALVTAADESAPNMLMWENPFSWYYHGGVDGEIKRRVEAAGGRYDNNEIRCSLIWEGYTDLDLHCVTPNGAHIYYATKTDRTGGWLDVDANGGIPTTLTPVENVRWAEHAPQGFYRFYVHNFYERGKGRTPFKVELEVAGKVYMYHGEASGTGFKEDIFVFDYRGGQIADIRAKKSVHIESTWAVSEGEYTKVSAITTSPNLWGENPVEHSGSHVFFLLDGCKDKTEGMGRGFFAEMLKPEFREIRKTLDAYCANTPIEGADAASACGLGYNKDSEWNLIVRVTSGTTTKTTRIIKIDRFD